MSTPEHMTFAALHESSTTHFRTLTGHLLAGFCGLAQLNLVTCGVALSGVRRNWESTRAAQTPEQLVQSQADILPSLAAQFAGYTNGWMEIAAETSGKLSRLAHVWTADNLAHVETSLAASGTGSREFGAVAPAANVVADGLVSVPAKADAPHPDVLSADAIVSADTGR